MSRFTLKASPSSRSIAFKETTAETIDYLKTNPHAIVDPSLTGADTYAELIDALLSGDSDFANTGDLTINATRKMKIRQLITSYYSHHSALSNNDTEQARIAKIIKFMGNAQTAKPFLVTLQMHQATSGLADFAMRKTLEIFGFNASQFDYLRQEITRNAESKLKELAEERAEEARQAQKTAARVAEEQRQDRLAREEATKTLARAREQEALMFQNLWESAAELLPDHMGKTIDAAKIYYQFKIPGSPDPKTATPGEISQFIRELQNEKSMRESLEAQEAARTRQAQALRRRRRRPRTKTTKRGVTPLAAAAAPMPEPSSSSTPPTTVEPEEPFDAGFYEEAWIAGVMEEEGARTLRLNPTNTAQGPQTSDDHNDEEEQSAAAAAPTPEPSSSSTLPTSDDEPAPWETEEARVAAQPRPLFRPISPAPSEMTAGVMGPPAPLDADSDRSSTPSTGRSRSSTESSWSSSEDESEDEDEGEEEEKDADVGPAQPAERALRPAQLQHIHFKNHVWPTLFVDGTYLDTTSGRRATLTKVQVREAHAALQAFLGSPEFKDDEDSCLSDTLNHDNDSHIKISRFYNWYGSKLEGGAHEQYYNTIQIIIANTQHFTDQPNFVSECVLAFLTSSIENKKLTHTQFKAFIDNYCDGSPAPRCLEFVRILNEANPQNLDFAVYKNIILELVNNIIVTLEGADEQIHRAINQFLTHAIAKNQLDSETFTTLLEAHAGSTDEQKRAFLLAFNNNMPGSVSQERHTELVTAMLENNRPFLANDTDNVKRALTNTYFQYIKLSKEKLTPEIFQQILGTVTGQNPRFIESSILTAVQTVAKHFSTTQYHEIILVLANRYGQLNSTSKETTRDLLVNFFKLNANNLTDEQYQEIRTAFRAKLPTAIFLDLVSQGTQQHYSARVLRNVDRHPYFVGPMMPKRYPAFAEAFQNDVAQLMRLEPSSLRRTLELERLENIAHAARYMPLEQRRKILESILPELQRLFGIAVSRNEAGPGIPQHTHKAILRVIETWDNCNHEFFQRCRSLYEAGQGDATQRKELCSMVIARLHDFLKNEDGELSAGEASKGGEALALIKSFYIPNIHNTSDVSTLLSALNPAYFKHEDREQVKILRDDILLDIMNNIAQRDNPFSADAYLERYLVNQCLDFINRKNVSALLLIGIANSVPKFNYAHQLILITALAKRFDERNTKTIGALASIDTDGSSTSTDASSISDEVYPSHLAHAIHTQVLRALAQKTQISEPTPDADHLAEFAKLYPILNEATRFSGGDHLSEERIQFVTALTKYFQRLPEPRDSRRNKAIMRTIHQTICNMIREGELPLNDELFQTINGMYGEDSPNRSEFEAAVLARPYIFLGSDTANSVLPRSIEVACKTTLEKRIQQRKSKGILTKNTPAHELSRCFVASMINVRNQNELDHYLSHPLSRHMLSNTLGKLQILRFAPDVIATTDCKLGSFGLNEDNEDDRNTLHQAIILRLTQGSEIPPSLLVRTDAHMNPDNIITYCADIYSTEGYFASDTEADDHRKSFQITLTQNAALLISKGASFNTLFGQAHRSHSLQSSAESYVNFSKFTLSALDVLFMQRLQFADNNRDATDAVIKEFKHIYKQAEEGGLAGARQQYEAFLKHHRFFIADRRGDLRATHLSAKDHANQTRTELLAWIELYKTHKTRTAHASKDEISTRHLINLAYSNMTESPVTRPHLWFQLPDPTPAQFAAHLNLITDKIARVTNTIERQKLINVLIQNAYTLFEAVKSELHHGTRLQYVRALKNAFQTLHINMTDVFASVYDQLDALSRRRITDTNPDGSAREPEEYKADANANHQQFMRLIRYARSGLFTGAEETQLTSLIQRRAAGLRLAGVKAHKLGNILFPIDVTVATDNSICIELLSSIIAHNPALDQAEAQLMFQQITELAQNPKHDQFSLDDLSGQINHAEQNGFYSQAISLLSADVSFSSIAEYFEPEGIENGLNEQEVFAAKIKVLTTQFERGLLDLCRMRRNQETSELSLGQLNPAFSRIQFITFTRAINTLAETNDSEAVTLRAQLRRAIYLSAAALIQRGIGFSELQELCPSLTAAHIVAQAQDPAFAEAHLKPARSMAGSGSGAGSTRGDSDESDEGLSHAAEQGQRFVIDYMLNLRDERSVADPMHPGHKISWVNRLLTSHEGTLGSIRASLVPDDIDTGANKELKQRIENARLAYQRLPMEVRERVRLDYRHNILIDSGRRNHLYELLTLIEHQSRISRTHLCNALRDGSALDKRVSQHHQSMDELLHGDRSVRTLEETKRLVDHWESLPTEDFNQFSDEKGEEDEHVLLALGHEVEAMYRLLNPGIDEYLKPALNIAFINPNYEDEEDEGKEEEKSTEPKTLRLSSEEISVLMSIAHECSAPSNPNNQSDLDRFAKAIQTKVEEIKNESADEDSDTPTITRKREVCKKLNLIFNDNGNLKKLADASLRESQRLTRRFHNHEQLQNMGEQYAARASVLQARITDVERLLMEACGRNQTGRSLEEKLTYLLSRVTFETIGLDGKATYRNLHNAEQRAILAVLKEEPAIAMTPHGLINNIDLIRARLRVKLNADTENPALQNLVNIFFAKRHSTTDEEKSIASVNIKRLATAFHATLKSEMLHVSQGERQRELRTLDPADPHYEHKKLEVIKKHQAQHENRRKLIKDHELLMERCSTLRQREQQARDLASQMANLRDNVIAAHDAHQNVPADKKAQYKEISGGFRLSKTIETEELMQTINHNNELKLIMHTEGMNAAIAAYVSMENAAIDMRNAGGIAISRTPMFKSTSIMSQQQARVMAMTGTHTTSAGTAIERYEQRGEKVVHTMHILTAQTLDDKLNPQQELAAQKDILDNLFKLALQFETNVMRGGGKPQLSFNAHAVKDPKQKQALIYNLKRLVLILSFKYPNLKVSVLGCDISLPTQAERDEFITGLNRIGMETEASALQANDPKFRKMLKESSAEEREARAGVAFSRSPGSAAAA